MRLLADLDDVRAAVNLGALLDEMGRPADAVAAYEEVIDRFGNDAIPAVRTQVARALFGRGDRWEILISPMMRSPPTTSCSRALATTPPRGCASRPPRRWSTRPSRSDAWSGRRTRSPSTTCCSRASATTPPGLREQIAKALVGKAITLGRLERPEDAIAVYDVLLARFGDDPAPGVREQAAKALVGKGVALGELERPEDEIAVYDELVARFGDDLTPGVREQAAAALLNKAITLGRLERPEDEIAVYDELLARFGDDLTRGCASGPPPRWSTRPSRSDGWSASRTRSPSTTSCSRASATT